MKTKLAAFGVILLLQLGFNAQQVNLNNEFRVFNNENLNSKNYDVILFNIQNESDLLETISAFKIKNNYSELEDMVILEFLELQLCTNEQGSHFQDYPNELQSIFDFYISLSKNEIDWLNDAELRILKFTSLEFIVNYPNDIASSEHLKAQLKNCMNDIDYAKLIMSSSKLNECIEKR